MQKLSSFDSIKTVESFLDTLKKGVKKSEIVIEYFELTLKEPHYEKLNCAYVQTANQKEGILYEAVTRRFFYIKEELVNKAEKKYVPSMSALTSTVASQFPKAINDKLIWVSVNKADKKLEIEDFGTSFTLTKPSK